MCTCICVVLMGPSWFKWLCEAETGSQGITPNPTGLTLWQWSSGIQTSTRRAHDQFIPGAGSRIVLKPFSWGLFMLSRGIVDRGIPCTGSGKFPIPHGKMVMRRDNITRIARQRACWARSLDGVLNAEDCAELEQIRRSLHPKKWKWANFLAGTLQCVI